MESSSNESELELPCIEVFYLGRYGRMRPHYDGQESMVLEVICCFNIHVCFIIRSWHDWMISNVLALFNKF